MDFAQDNAVNAKFNAVQTNVHFKTKILKYI